MIKNDQYGLKKHKPPEQIRKWRINAVEEQPHVYDACSNTMKKKGLKMKKKYMNFLNYTKQGTVYIYITHK